VRNDAATLAAWHARFMDEVIRPQIRPQARALVARHLDAGALTALVTATNDFVTAPIAREFGIEHLIATCAEHDGHGYTGRIAGTPAFRDGKVVRTDAWLAGLGLAWDRFAVSHFYSDSVNDIPLMERVGSPVATNPDARLRAHAQARGWPILELFA
jgi:HAD superfamily hydrolase (TIGR01490 family)